MKAIQSMTLPVALPNGSLTRFTAQSGSWKPALILCPGGGYEFCSIREGAPVARAFAGLGIETFVLEYDCEPVPLGNRPLHTLAAAVAWVRQNADDFSIDTERIAVGGFSAGAHLAGLLGTVWNRPAWFTDAPASDPQKIRPNAMILCYPVITAGAYAHRDSFVRLAGPDDAAQQRLSLENLVNTDTPPAFLWHTLDDATVPVENTLLMADKLHQAGISYELHLFPHGVHGLALADFETYDPMRGRLPDRHIARWPALCAEWLKAL